MISRRLITTFCWAGAVLFCTVAAFAFQKDFRQYPAQEYTTFDIPPHGLDPAEFVFGHLMYPDASRRGGFGGFGRGCRSSDWRGGCTDWTNDYPRSDRHLLLALNRLTSIQARGTEQPVNLEDDDDVYNWPFLYAVRAKDIDLSDPMIEKLRDYIDRGGFLIADDMWGDREHEAVFELVARLYPKRDLIDLPDDALAFHQLFDLNKRYQIIGQWGRFNGQPLNGGIDPHWMGMFDEKGRMVIAVWLNNDTGDSWEWADDPTYPEKWSALGIRMAINHVAYAMTH